MELYRTRSGAVWPRLPHSQLGSAKLRCPPILLPEVRHLAIEGDLVMAAFAKRVLHLFNRGLEMVAGIVNRTLSLSFENCPQNMNCNVSLTELDVGVSASTTPFGWFSAFGQTQHFCCQGQSSVHSWTAQCIIVLCKHISASLEQHRPRAQPLPWRDSLFHRDRLQNHCRRSQAQQRQPRHTPARHDPGRPA